MYSRDQQVLAHLGLDSSLLSFLSFCCCCWTPLPSFSTCLTDPLGLSFLGDTVTSLLTVIQQELMGPFIFTPDFPWLFYSLSLCALVSGGGGVFFLSVFWCWVELMLLFPENGHCGAVKEAMGAWDLILLLDVWPCMEKAMAPHSSTLAWKSPRIEEPGGLQSMGSLGVRHDWVTSLSPFTFMHWRRKWRPTPVFLPGESQGWGNLLGCCLWGRTESDTTEAT